MVRVVIFIVLCEIINGYVIVSINSVMRNSFCFIVELLMVGRINFGLEMFFNFFWKVGCKSWKKKIIVVLINIYC